MGSHWKNYNANPRRRRTGDCTIRAICTALGADWYATYFDVVIEGAVEADMPSTNRVWRKFLRRLGFRMCLVDDHGRNCYSVNDFCEEHPDGAYILALDGHVVAVIDGEYYDTWESGDEEPVYYWIIKDGDETNK
jgi:hypothetical protein